MERHPSRRLETRICIPILSLAGLPHTVVQVVDCPNLGSTLHIEVCVDSVPEVVQCITIFGTLTHYLPLGSNNKRTSQWGYFWRADNHLGCFHSPRSNKANELALHKFLLTK